MEICHFFVNFYDFVMKCVYKSTIYTFVIRDKIWTPPLCCTKVYMLLLCFGSRKHPPHPIHVRHFCVSPPPAITANYTTHYTTNYFLTIKYYVRYQYDISVSIWHFLVGLLCSLSDKSTFFREHVL